jgi:hypothetical protein
MESVSLIDFDVEAMDLALASTIGDLAGREVEYLRDEELHLHRLIANNQKATSTIHRFIQPLMTSCSRIRVEWNYKDGIVSVEGRDKDSENKDSSNETTTKSEPDSRDHAARDDKD